MTRFFCVAVLAASVAGCGLSASQIKAGAGYFEGKADELRASKLASAMARRQAALRIYCSTTIADVHGMTPAERGEYGKTCGFDWLQ